MCCFLPQFILSAVPAALWLTISLLLGLWGSLQFRRRSTAALAAVLLLTGTQSLVLLTWITERTATTIFNTYSVDVRSKVLSPDLEHPCMLVFWLIAFLSIGIVAWAAWTYKARSGNRAWRIVSGTWLGLQLFLLLGISSNLANYRRMPGHAFNIETSSPDGRWTARLVPMFCMIDTNGLVMIRSQDEFWWHPVARMGDELSERDKVSIEWKPDSTGFMVIGQRASTKEDEKLLEYEIGATSAVRPTSGH